MRVVSLSLVLTLISVLGAPWALAQTPPPTPMTQPTPFPTPSPTAMIQVLTGGRGAGSVVSCLQSGWGSEVQPVQDLTGLRVPGTKVLVLAQPGSPDLLDSATVSRLAKSVRKGLGIVITHDAVGYRGYPPLFPEICRFGVVHVEETRWMPVLEGPLTKGLRIGEPLEHTDEEHIALEPGPNAEVVARGVANDRPVVLAGPSGKGRVVACGLGLGRGPGEQDVPLSPAEATLLLNAVQWTGRLQDP